jgi:glycosyltransferase involved in cell wall biosynthesis
VKIFLATTSLLPDYGGPAFSISRLALALADAGAEVGLWASDRSAVTSPLLPATSRVQRLAGTEAEALDTYGEVDVLHDNGIWLLHHHRLAVLADRRGIRRVVSTRGMLEPWAVSHKRFRKGLAWRLYQECDLKRARCHITSGELEARNLQRFELGVPIVTIPNGVDTPKELTGNVAGQLSRGGNGRQRTALFLGRIYPIKGLPMLIEAWARVRPEGWRLRIAGPDEAGHKRQVERTISAAGLGRVVSFAGPIEPERKKAAFLEADLFILPSHSESFGMAVAEAMAHGLPVLTTTAAPWSILRENNCGWWVDPTIDGLAQALCQATRLDTEALRAMGAKGRALIGAEFSWARIADRMLSTYGDLARDPGLTEEHRPRFA